jgi:RNase H-like domain found in reverse transcriptase
LLLLGQKVSRLGLSTHKEKVNAILQLAEPQNVSELQTFLGMMVYFSSYVPFYAWIAQPLFQLLKKDIKWHWGPLQTEAFELCKQVLTNAPVRAYAIPGMPYRIYTDACDYGLAAILQQIQPIKIRDLKGTRSYDRLLKAYEAHEPVPKLVLAVANPEEPLFRDEWAENFEDTTVHLERVISYWSRILKSAERNYSPTEREALALKEGLIKFQPFLEGEVVTAITDHAALTWSKTYQNVNRRLLSWGTVLAGYPNLKIVHRAGRVHSNVDPISRLRRRVPYQEGPLLDSTGALKLEPSESTWRSKKVGENMAQIDC